jgi:hypothetical protein
MDRNECMCIDTPWNGFAESILRFQQPLQFG